MKNRHRLGLVFLIIGATAVTDTENEWALAGFAVAMLIGVVLFMIE